MPLAADDDRAHRAEGRKAGGPLEAGVPVEHRQGAEQPADQRTQEGRLMNEARIAEAVAEEPERDTEHRGIVVRLEGEGETQGTVGDAESESRDDGEGRTGTVEASGGRARVRRLFHACAPQARQSMTQWS